MIIPIIQIIVIQVVMNIIMEDSVLNFKTKIFLSNVRIIVAIMDFLKATTDIKVFVRFKILKIIS